MPGRSVHPAAAGRTSARLKEAALLSALAPLTPLAVWWLLRDQWVAQLGDIFGRYLSAIYPRTAAVAVMCLLAVTVIGLYRVRRRHKAKPSVEPEKTSRRDPVEFQAYALLGVLYVIVVSGVGLRNLSLLIAPELTRRYPQAAGLASLAATGLALLALFRLANRRKRRPAASAEDRAVASMHRLFIEYLIILIVSFGLGVTVLITLHLTNAIREAWVTFYPWTPLAFVLAILTGIADSLRSHHRTTPRPSTARALGNAAETVLLFLGLFILAVLLLFWNYRGLLDSSAVFAQVSPAVRAAFFAMPSIFLAFVLSMLLLFARAGRRARVFISFQHTREKTAIELERALHASGLIVRRIPFRDDYQHDALLREIQEEIRRCDAVVCLPGARPSFVENEILVASTLRRYIVFLVGKTEPRLPNTAYYGYPVFRLERVERLEFKPVAELILLVAGNWRASWRYFLDSWTRLFNDGKTLVVVVMTFVLGTYLVGVSLASLPGSGTDPWRVVSRFHRIYLDLLGNWTPLWIWLNLFLIGSAFALVNQIRARRVLRQDVLTGHLTLPVLRERLGNGKRTRRLLACLWKEPPRAEHEA